MALDFIDRLIVVIEQGRLARAASNAIDRIISGITEIAVIFILLQTRFLRRNS